MVLGMRVEDEVGGGRDGFYASAEAIRLERELRRLKREYDRTYVLFQKALRLLSSVEEGEKREAKRRRKDDISDGNELEEERVA